MFIWGSLNTFLSFLNSGWHQQRSEQQDSAIAVNHTIE